MTLDDVDLWPPPEPSHAEPRKCLHPRRDRRPLEDGGTSCGRCGKAIAAEASRRGRTSRSRGNAIEREVGKRLGLRRVGQYGGPDDLAGEMFAVQVKSGGSFPEKFWRWIKAVPSNASQTPLLVVTDAPGPGYRRRAVVVLDLDDWISLHGPSGVLPADPLTVEDGAA